MKPAAVILAGGAGSRMGPQPIAKPLLPLAGKPLIHWAKDAIEASVFPLIINSPNDAAYAAFNLPIVADLRPGLQGPLAGIEAAHRFLSTGFPQAAHMLTVAGDTPFLPPDLTAALSAGSAGRVRIARSAGKLHPTIALWPLAALDALSSYLDDAANSRSVLRFAERHGVDIVDFAIADGMDPFFNINTPEDLRVAEAYAARKSS